MKYYRMKQAADILKVSPSTVRRYCDDGVIQSERNIAGQRIVSEKEIQRLQHNPEPEAVKVVGYVRSSDGQKASLTTQEELILSQYPSAVIVRDSGSGLNENRRGLHKALRMIQEQESSILVVTNPDRLSRFGNTYLQMLIESYGGSVVFLNPKDNKTPHEELISDFMSLIASFSGRFYRLRGWEQQKQLLQTAQNRITNHQQNQSTQNDS